MLIFYFPKHGFLGLLLCCFQNGTLSIPPPPEKNMFVYIKKKNNNINAMKWYKYHDYYINIKMALRLIHAMFIFLNYY